MCHKKTCGGLNFKESITWNKAAIGKHFCALAQKQDRLWIKWLHAYYIKRRDIWSMMIPMRLSWAMKKILEARIHLENQANCMQFIHNKKFSIKKFYWFLRGDKPQVPWKRIICNSKSSPIAVFITWLLLQGTLTKDKLLQWGITTDGICILCNVA